MVLLWFEAQAWCCKEADGTSESVIPLYELDCCVGSLLSRFNDVGDNGGYDAP